MWIHKSKVNFTQTCTDTDNTLLVMFYSNITADIANLPLFCCVMRG